MARISIRLPDDLDKRVEATLDYNDTKSEFYRQAAEEKLRRMQASEADGSTADA